MQTLIPTPNPGLPTMHQTSKNDQRKIKIRSKEDQKKIEDTTKTGGLASNIFLGTESFLEW